MLQKDVKSRKRQAAPRTGAAKKSTTPARRNAPEILSVSDERPATTPGRAAMNAPRAGTEAAKPGVSHEERWRMVAEAAYYRAQRRGFGGDSVRDWIEAEAEVDAMLLNRR